MKVLVTGSNGFIGVRLFSSLDRMSIPYVCVYRNAQDNAKRQVYDVKSIDGNTSWVNAFDSIDVVIHMAARVHIMLEKNQNPLAEFRKVNVDGTLNFARKAAEAGVRRFIFISSVKVNGESTSGKAPFSETNISDPTDPYGVSKKEAEEGLRIIASQTGMEVVIIRPPLVYGPGVKANFLNLLKLADTRLPLPFGAIYNKRSMVYIENLIDFIIKCIDHPSAANETFLISDGKDLSLSSLLVMMRRNLGRSACLISLQASWFCFFGRLLDKSSMIDRLVGDLQVDSSKARKALNWEPPFTVEQGIHSTVAAYLRKRNL